jgi:hypothetical protein
MRRIGELIGHELRWERPHALKMEYELRDASDRVATLRFRSPFGSLATGESAEESWTFKRVGFLQTRATIRTSGSDLELAVFRNNSWTGGGTLELPDGRRYAANTNFWATSYAFTGPAGEPLVQYRRPHGLSLMPSVVEIHSAAARLDELPWLVILGWYLAIQLQQDAGVAGVVAAGGAMAVV